MSGTNLDSSTGFDQSQAGGPGTGGLGAAQNSGAGDSTASGGSGNTVDANAGLGPNSPSLSFTLGDAAALGQAVATGVAAIGVLSGSVNTTTIAGVIAGGLSISRDSGVGTALSHAAADLGAIGATPASQAFASFGIFETDAQSAFDATSGGADLQALLGPVPGGAGDLWALAGNGLFAVTGGSGTGPIGSQDFANEFIPSSGGGSG